MDRLHILDGYGYIYRAHYALMGARGREVRLSTSYGMPTGALYVYAAMLIQLYLDERPERIVVVFDAPGRTFRDEIFSEYKATRSETPDELKVQLPYFRKLTEVLCWPVIAVPGVEADDVIATLVSRARERDWEVTLFSADKDLMGLVDEHVVMIDSLRRKTYDIEGVTKKFGVPPEKVSEWLALVGDTSDNIPGVAGVGAKTAAKLLNEHGSIDGILAAAGTFTPAMKKRFTAPESLEALDRSRRLVELRRDVELPMALDELRARPLDPGPLEELFTKLEFNVLLERLGAQGEQAAATATDTPIESATIARTPADVAALAKAVRAAGRVAIAVETDGQRLDRANVVGIAACVENSAPVYIPVAHRYLGVPQPVTRQELSPFADALADPRVAVVCHDLKAAARAMARIDIEVSGVACDSMLASYLLDATETRLEDLVRSVAKIELPDRKAVLGTGKRAISFEAVSIEAAAEYTGQVAGAVLRTADVLERRIAAEGLGGLWTELELPLAHLLARIESIGITLDTEYLRELSDEIGEQLAALESRCYELAGEQFNLGSPKQLAALLFDKLGLTSERMKKTKTGYSTDHEVLEAMIHTHPIVAPILEHRELIKLKGTYLDALPPLVNPQTGRLHTEFRQAVAATGRLSSQDPNLQNIPIRSEVGKKIRRAFVAAPGKMLVSADYSQIELRVLAHLSRDPVLVAAFEQGIDVHTHTASEVFGIPRDEVGDHERRVAKAVNYGLIYGQSDFGLSRALDIPRQEARHYIERYFERFSVVREFMDQVVAEARRTGYSKTILGRRRPIPDLGSRNYRLRNAAERVAQNTPIQGSGADIMKLAMLRVDGLIRDESHDAQILLTVHDELVFEVDADSAQQIAARLAKRMESAYELSVPLRVDVGIASNWADAH